MVTLGITSKEKYNIWRVRCCTNVAVKFWLISERSSHYRINQNEVYKQEENSKFCEKNETAKKIIPGCKERLKQKFVIKTLINCTLYIFNLILIS